MFLQFLYDRHFRYLHLKKYTCLFRLNALYFILFTLQNVLIITGKALAYQLNENISTCTFLKIWSKLSFKPYNRCVIFHKFSKKDGSQTIKGSNKTEWPYSLRVYLSLELGKNTKEI